MASLHPQLVGMRFLSNKIIVNVHICSFVNFSYSNLSFCEFFIFRCVPLWISFYHRHRTSIIVTFKLELLSSSQLSLTFCHRLHRHQTRTFVALSLSLCHRRHRFCHRWVFWLASSNGKEERERWSKGHRKAMKNQLLHVGVHCGEQLLQSRWRRATTAMINSKP